MTNTAPIVFWVSWKPVCGSDPPTSITLAVVLNCRISGTEGCAKHLMFKLDGWLRLHSDHLTGIIHIVHWCTGLCSR